MTSQHLTDGHSNFVSRPGSKHAHQDLRGFRIFASTPVWKVKSVDGGQLDKEWPIQAAKMDGVDPRASHADIFSRIAAHMITRIDELFPLRYAPSRK